MFTFLSLSRSKKIDVSSIKDPNFGQQFFIKNDGHNNFLKGEDLNVIPAWEKGFSGEGRTITVLSRGAKLTHVDLKDKVNTEFNYNFADKSKNPSQDPSTSAIGTEVLGVAAAQINEKASVGVAPDAKVSSVSFDTTKSYTSEGIAAILGDENIKGDVIVLPHRLVATGQQWIDDEDISFGFAGRSGIDSNTSAYVIPTGNDGHLGADTSMFPGMCSRFVIPVGASTVRGASAYYSTGGACVSVVAPDSGLPDDITPEMRDFPKLGVLDSSDDELVKETAGRTEHAAAEVAGVIALMREANPEISANDIQLILQHTATKIDPNSLLWQQNKAGYWYHPKLGFGRVNADLAIEAARQWGSKKSEVADGSGMYEISGGVQISTTEEKILPIDVSADSDFFYFGSLTLKTNKLDLSGLRISVESPSGSKFTILNPSTYKPSAGENDIKITDKTDKVRIGFRCFFGEKVAGKWNIYIHHTDGINDDVLTSLDLSITAITNPDFPEMTKQQALPAEMGYAEYQTEPSFSLESNEIECGSEVKLTLANGPPENYQNIRVPLYLVDISNNRTVPVTSFLWGNGAQSINVKLPCMYATGKYGLSVRLENTLYQISHNITLKNNEEVKVVVPAEAKTSNEFKIKWASRYKSIKPPGIYQKAVVTATDIESNKVLFADTVLENGEATIKLQSGTKRDNIVYSVTPIYHKMEQEVPTPAPIPMPSPTPTSLITKKPTPTPKPKPENQGSKKNGLNKGTIAAIAACGVVAVAAIAAIVAVCLCKSRKSVSKDASTSITEVLLT